LIITDRYLWKQLVERKHRGSRC